MVMRRFVTAMCVISTLLLSACSGAEPESSSASRADTGASVSADPLQESGILGTWAYQDFFFEEYTDQGIIRVYNAFRPWEWENPETRQYSVQKVDGLWRITITYDGESVDEYFSVDGDTVTWSETVEEARAGTSTSKWTRTTFLDDHASWIAEIDSIEADFSSVLPVRKLGIGEGSRFGAALVPAFVGQLPSWTTSNQSGPERAADRFDVTYFAYMDVATDGKFSDIWIQMLSRQEDRARFTREVAQPIEAAYASGDFSAVVAAVRPYVDSAQFDDHVSNLNLGIAAQVSRGYMIQNNISVDSSEHYQYLKEADARVTDRIHEQGALF